ncbi:MAG: hypothetical protein ACSLFK_11745, partial [Gemmatimonadaceae bacterium]
MNLKTRIVIILGLIIASAVALFPRNVKERVKTPTGFAYDTVRRVPLKLGLDLQGGMHLALEVDESKGVVADKSEALDRALTVIRSRIDQFGVAEPLVQKSGSDRIIVELPGIDDPERAQEVVQQSAFLQFQITDKTQALERAMPRLDAAVAAAGTVAAPASPSASDTGRRAPTVIGGLLTADTSAVATTDSARADTAVAPTGGQFSRLIQQGQMPGEYFVSEADVPALESYLAMPQVRAAIPPGKEILFGSDTSQIANQQYRAIYVVDQRPIITGEYLT